MTGAERLKSGQSITPLTPLVYILDPLQLFHHTTSRSPSHFTPQNMSLYFILRIFDRKYANNYKTDSILFIKGYNIFIFRIAPGETCGYILKIEDIMRNNLRRSLYVLQTILFFDF